MTSIPIATMVALSIAMCAAKPAAAQTAKADFAPALAVGATKVSGYVTPATADKEIVVEARTADNGVLVRRTVKQDRDGSFDVDVPGAGLPDKITVRVLDGATELAREIVTTRVMPPETLVINVDPVMPGDTHVRGLVTPAASTARLTLEVESAEPAFHFRKTVTRDADGRFDVEVPALKPGHTVAVAPGGPVPVVVPPLGPVTLRAPIRDGARVIDGQVGAGDARADVLVTVHASLGKGLEGTWIQQKRVKPETNGAFSLALSEPVLAGQTVEARAIVSDDAVSPATRIVVTDPGSWGRTRAYFAGGVIFSKEREDFSKQDMALSIGLDKSWLQRSDMVLQEDFQVRTDRDRERPTGVAPNADDPLRPCVKGRAETREECKRTVRWFYPRQLNTFFEARFTALPVSATENETTTTSGQQQTTTVTDRFIASRKGAMVQVGIYAPAYGPATTWRHEGQLNTLFLAPVFRYGIQTVTETSQPGATSTDTKSNGGGGSPSTTTKTTTTTVPNDALRSMSFGFGLGHYRLSGTRDQAPELISYLHLTWGHSDAFPKQFKTNDKGEFVGADDKPLAAGASPIVTVGARRLFVEGRLKVPSTGIQLGFDANLGDGHDDIRFTVGTRFDIGQLIGRLQHF